MTTLSKSELVELFNGYNNNNQKAVNKLIAFLTDGSIITEAGGTITGDLTVTGNIFSNQLRQRTTAGIKIGNGTDKIGFFDTTPIVQPVFATGAGHTVDQLITVLQNFGLVRQS